MNLFLIIILVTIISPLSTTFASKWHTSPDKWKEPRIFHSPFQNEFEKQIVFTKIDNNSINIDENTKKYSPNGAYWFALKTNDKTGQYSNSSDLLIFNERGYLLKITLVNHAGQYEKKIYWVNEKLIYIQVWWGRILGSYLIFDVESEKVIIREMVNDGEILFHQFKSR